MSGLAQVNAIWRVPLILTLTAALASLSVVFSLWDGTGGLQHWCARTWSHLILSVCRVRVGIHGLEQLDRTRSYIFVANHLSTFDIWAFLAGLPFQFRFVAKSSLFRWPFLGWHLKRAGTIPIDRCKPRQALQAFREAGEKIRSGTSVVIFPEGKRTWGESVAPFKRGSFLLVQHAQVPVVPVTILGAHRLLPRGSAIISPGRMQLIIHSPIEYEHYKHLDLERLAQVVHSQIVESYREVS